MNTAKLFINGRSQAVRLPKDCRFEGVEVYIKKYGNMVLLLPVDDPWASLIDSLDQFGEDFMDERQQPLQQARRKS
jgi:antitoxin VapB